MNRKERIKQHFQQYKSYYIFFGTAVTVAGITTLIMRTPKTSLPSGEIMSLPSGDISLDQANAGALIFERLTPIS